MNNKFNDPLLPHDPFESLCRVIVPLAVEVGNAKEFIERFRTIAPLYLDDGFFPPGTAAASEKPRLFHAMARAFWNAIPLPQNHFRPHPLPSPERNQACPCGSGKKYKHCCVEFEQFPLKFESETFLMIVLERMKKKDLAAIPVKDLAPDLRAAIAKDWIMDGEPDRARLLLEPLFTDWAHVDRRADDAYTLLIDCYDSLNKPRKKTEFIDAGMACPTNTIRAAAMQRRATQFADQGDWDHAWHCFTEAQKLNPDDPSLSHLEILLLINQQKTQLAADRARFWITKFRKQKHLYMTRRRWHFLNRRQRIPSRPSRISSSSVIRNSRGC